MSSPSDHFKYYTLTGGDILSTRPPAKVVNAFTTVVHPGQWRSDSPLTFNVGERTITCYPSGSSRCFYPADDAAQAYQSHVQSDKNALSAFRAQSEAGYLLNHVELSDYQMDSLQRHRKPDSQFRIQFAKWHFREAEHPFPDFVEVDNINIPTEGDWDVVSHNQIRKEIEAEKKEEQAEKKEEQAEKTAAPYAECPPEWGPVGSSHYYHSFQEPSWRQGGTDF